MYNSKIQLRNVEEEDCEDLYKWRTNPVSMQMAFNKEEIPYENHLEWFKNSLQNTNRVLYIALNDGGEKIGQIRFDRAGNKSLLAVVDVTVDPNQRGKRYGKEIIKNGSIRYLKENDPKVIIAQIREINIPSVKAFSKAGYKEFARFDGIIEMFFE